MIKVSTPLLRSAALTVLATSLAFASPSFAQSAMGQDDADQSTSAPMGSSAPMASDTSTPVKSHGQMHVEQRIKTLHDKLKITSAQEDEWSKVAQTMRDNEANLDQLVQTRHQNAESMTAIDDIKSYAQITQAHADGMQKLASAFEPLYNDMSDSQKKNADTLFGHFEGHRAKMLGKKHS
jgi:Skp family chaperone for outer membrane proteins